MPYATVELPRFTGLRLNADSQEAGWNGAVTGLNFDVDHDGRVRSRDGFQRFGTHTATTGYTSIGHWYATAGIGTNSDTFVVADGTTWRMIGDANATGLTASPPPTFQQHGQAMYGSNGIEVRQWTSSLDWIAVTATVDGVAAQSYPRGRLLAVTPNSDRMVSTGFREGLAGMTDGPDAAASGIEYIFFSEPGDATTWLTANFVRLTPHDGELIKAAVTWQNYLFVFKETKYFVFYGETTDAAGDTEFNYRTIEGIGISGGAQPHLATAGKDGVYFANQHGVYVTNGGPARKISDNIAPLFRRTVAYNDPADQGAVYIDAPILTFLAPIALEFFDDRLYVSYGSTSTTTPDMTLVYDTRSGEWMIWDVAAYGMVVAPQSGVDMLHITGRVNPAASNILYLDPTLTVDRTASDIDIESHYQTGYSDLGTPGSEKVVREWLVDGSGSVTLRVLHSDYNVTDQTGTSEALTLGTGLSGGLTTIRRDRMRKAVRGHSFAVRFESASEQWEVNRVVAHVRSERPAGIASA